MSDEVTTLFPTVDDSTKGVPFWPRAGARIIDMVLHYAVALVGGVCAGIVIAILAVARNRNPDSVMQQATSGVLPFLGALVGATLGGTVMEAVHGSTFGKRILGYVVLGENGAPCTLTQAFKRNLLYLVDSLFFGVIAWNVMKQSPSNQRYGDQWADTIVRERKDVSPSVLRSDGTFVVAVLAGCAVDAACIGGFMVLKSLI